MFESEFFLSPLFLIMVPGFFLVFVLSFSIVLRPFPGGWINRIVLMAALGGTVLLILHQKDLIAKKSNGLPPAILMQPTSAQLAPLLFGCSWLSLADCLPANQDAHAEKKSRQLLDALSFDLRDCEIIPDLFSPVQCRGRVIGSLAKVALRKALVFCNESLESEPSRRSSRIQSVIQEEVTVITRFTDLTCQGSDTADSELLTLPAIQKLLREHVTRS